MKLCGAFILTDNAPKLAGFYYLILYQKTTVNGSHFSFDNAQLAVYNPGNVNVVKDKNMSLMYM